MSNGNAKCAEMRTKLALYAEISNCNAKCAEMRTEIDICAEISKQDAKCAEQKNAFCLLAWFFFRVAAVMRRLHKCT